MTNLNIASSGACTRLLATTNPGLEDVVVAEARERAAEVGARVAHVELSPGGHEGRVRVDIEGSWDVARRAALGMRSVHHVLRPLSVVELPPDASALEVIWERVRGLEIPELAGGASFRVRTRRIGAHDFGSPDVERIAGDAIRQRYDAPVDLERYDLCVRADVRERVCTIGVQLTRDALSRRHVRRYKRRSGLKTNVAYAALRLAELPSRGRLLDPFCGSGTLVLEAADACPDIEIHASDWSARAVRGTRDNLSAADLVERVHVQQADARALREVYPEGHFDAVVGNPPYGMRMGRGIEFEPFYARLLGSIRAVLRPQGRLVLFVHKVPSFQHALRGMGGYRIVEARPVETGGLTPTLFVLERLPD